jgi:hypothetical protein
MERRTYCLPEQHDVTERSPDGGQDSRHFETCGRVWLNQDLSHVDRTSHFEHAKYGRVGIETLAESL